MVKAFSWLAIMFAAAFLSPAAAAASGPVKTLHVDVNAPRAQVGGSCGSAQVPCRRITDALARARQIRFEQMLEPDYSEATVRPIEIVIAPGSYAGTFGDNPDGTLEEYPLLINVPRVALRGATRLELNELGRPNVVLQADGSTLEAADDRVNTVLRMRLAEVRQSNEYVVLVLPTTRLATGQRSSGAGATVEGLTFDVGPSAGNGAVLAADRAPGLAMRGCAFAVTGAMELANSSGRVEANLFYRGPGTALLVRGIDGSQPEGIVIRDNTSIGKPTGGLSLVASQYDGTVGVNGNSIYDLGRHASEFQVEPLAMAPFTSAHVLVENNRFAEAGLASPIQGFGVRVSGTDGQDQAQAATGTLNVTLRRNELTNNRDGLVLDGGFPYRSAGGAWTMNIHLALEDNTVAGNSRSSGTVTFTRHQTALAPNAGQNALALFKYAESSTFEIADPAGSVAGMLVDHLVQDPLSGTLLNNTFVYNGYVVAPPVRSCAFPVPAAPYAPAVPCAP